MAVLVIGSYIVCWAASVALVMIVVEASWILALFAVVPSVMVVSGDATASVSYAYVFGSDDVFAGLGVSTVCGALGTVVKGSIYVSVKRVRAVDVSLFGYYTAWSLHGCDGVNFRDDAGVDFAVCGSVDACLTMGAV